jgi:hypothetical protein
MQIDDIISYQDVVMGQKWGAHAPSWLAVPLAKAARAGLKAWPSLRVRCSGCSPKWTLNFRLISLAS